MATTPAEWIVTPPINAPEQIRTVHPFECRSTVDYTQCHRSGLDSNQRSSLLRRGLTLVLRKQPNNKVNTLLASNLDICNLASLYLVWPDQILHLANTGFTRLSAPDKYQTNERLVLPAERVFGLVSFKHRTVAAVQPLEDSKALPLPLCSFLLPWLINPSAGYTVP